MNSPNDRLLAALEGRVLLLLLAGVSLAFVWILLPFYGAILWGAVIALLFAPLNRRLLPRLGQRRTVAALLTMLAALVILVIPFALLTAALAREAAGLYARLRSGEVQPGRFFQGVFDALPGWATNLLDRAGLVDFETLQRRLTAALAQASDFIATQALSIGQNTFQIVVQLFVTLYLAFFLIRDGDRVARAIDRAVPLLPEHKLALLATFTTVIRATVKGNLVVALVQGALGGLAFWFLGVHAALLAAVLMTFLSLLPAVGAGLVWAPVAIWFLVNGAVWQGLALIAWGVLVIGLVDNLLRPILVGRETRMPDYVVLISTLGGLVAFGLNGFVLGPAIAAMFIAVWKLYGEGRVR
jgi:predicted PurR-regulated permease PerM